MDYLNYGKQVQQQTQPQKPQPQGFGQQKVQLTTDDFSFGDLKQQTTQSQTAPLPPENKREILQLFPSPLIITSIPFNYEKELEWIKKNKFCRENASFDGSSELILNSQSDDTFILDNPELKKIRLWIESEIDGFAKNVLGSESELVITQSWLNRNLKGQLHHDHLHPNSIISGVWYPFCHEKLPAIAFKNKYQPQVHLSIKEYNTFNSASFVLPINMGELILFPSYLIHGVPQNQSDEARISLSFNTWCKGSMGNLDSLTYLPMDRCV